MYRHLFYFFLLAWVLFASLANFFGFFGLGVLQPTCISFYLLIYLEFMYFCTCTLLHIHTYIHTYIYVCICCNVGPLLFNGCANLLDIGRNWNTLSYTPIQSIPNMLNGWHVRWVCWPCKNWDVFSCQELCTDPCNMGPCIIMLQHEVMVVDEWHNNGPQDLVAVSLCIQNAINKMHLCSLSITYAAHTITPPPPWATRSTTLTSANRSPTRRHTRCLPSALYSENRDSSVKRTPLQSARRHRMWAFAHSSRLRRRTAVRSRPRWGRRACRWASLRRFLTVCAEILWLCKPIVAAAVGVAGLKTILEVKMLDVEVLGWCGYTWSAVVRPVECTAKFSETPLETAYGREMNIQFTGNSSGGHSCSQHANCTLPQNLRHLWHCAVW